MNFRDFLAVFLSLPQFFHFGRLEEIPFAIFINGEKDFLWPKDFCAMLALADVHLQIGILFLDVLKLVEGHPAVILVTAQHGCEHQTNHVRAAVFLACGRTERHSDSAFASPALFPSSSFFSQGEHVLGNAVYKFFLNIAAYLKAIFLCRIFAHAPSTKPTIMVSGS